MEKQLYLIPVGIAPGTPGMPGLPIDTNLLERIKIVFAEDLRSARRFFRQAGFTGDLNTQLWVEMNADTALETLLDAIRQVRPDAPAAVLSEAGIPGIADPGADIVTLAHQLDIRVIPLPGPSSIFLALAASGLNGQSFTFHGYLPIHDKERERQLRLIEHQALQTGYTQIFMETPYRNMQLLGSILKVCRNDTRLCIAADITGEREMIRTKTIQSWRSEKINIHKVPAVFLLNQ